MKPATSLCLVIAALPWCMLHAEPQNQSRPAFTPAGPGGVSRLAWPGQFDSLKSIALRTQVRWGSMYDLYSLNQTQRALEIRSTTITTEDLENLSFITAEGEGPGVSIRHLFELDAAAGTLKLTATLRRTQGSQPLKYQLVFVIEPECAHHEDSAWILPAPGRLAIVRSNDPSDANIFDQDGQTSFPIFHRLPERWALLSSLPDQRGILFHGNAVRHFRGPQRLNAQRVELYGNDRFLVEGETLTETLMIESAPGLGALGRNLSDIRNGLGALATRRYLIDDTPLRVLFTGTGNTETELRSDDRVLAQAKGSGTLELATAGLPDGEYQLVKRLHLPDRVLTDSEPVSILRDAFRRIAAESEGLRSLAESIHPATTPEPDAARARRALLFFLLGEITAYRARHQLNQMEALLADARHAAALLKTKAPAALPPPGEVVYQNTLTRETSDFDFFGAGEIEYDPEKGLFFGGEGTMNMWSTFTVEGSFLVEFDFLPLNTAGGGTMFQLCGRHPMPNSSTDFMTTASWGGMAHYMFGISCYHFSFGVRERDARLRKTGQGFHILATTPDPVAETGRWHRLAFARHGTRLLFFADNKLIQEYHDHGHRGPVLEGGRIGLRNWSGQKAWFRHLLVRRLPPP